jgi:hypothetical protein
MIFDHTIIAGNPRQTGYLTRIVVISVIISALKTALPREKRKKVPIQHGKRLMIFLRNSE